MNNLGTTERALRVLLGGASAIWALWLVIGGGAELQVLLYTHKAAAQAVRPAEAVYERRAGAARLR